MLGAILALDLLFQNKDYKCRKEFLLPNIALLILVFAICVSISCIVYKKWKEVVQTDKRRFVYYRCVFCFIIFTFTVYINEYLFPYRLGCG